jgi:acetylornithine deacetylase/succinyl-diaminopimelate desuccinylase-like protein
MADMNWDQAFEETVAHLRALVQIDTTNPPGRERPAAEYLAGVLQQEGLEPMVLESTPERANLVVRLRGTGEAPPLMLLSHLDVVPAEADKWQYPPFSAEVAEGYIWGRGTVDTKNLTAAELVIMLLLHRHNVPLKRDVIMVACADEEEHGGKGLAWLSVNHPDLVRSQYAINEGGGQSLDLRGQTYFTCQTAEKGVCWLRLRAHGEAGHGALPHEENAVVSLAEAVVKLGHTPLPVHLTQTTERFIEGLARGQGKETAALVRGLLDPAASSFLLRQLPINQSWARMLHGMLHNTATPTILQAGKKINVIPSTAEALVDGRVLPGQHPEQFLREVSNVVGPNVDVQVEEYAPALEAGPDTELYRAIEETLCDLEPQTILLPMMVCGATDAKHLAPLGIVTYGFCPMRDEGSISPMQLAHAHNERISLENVRFGLRTLYEVVVRFCTR